MSSVGPGLGDMRERAAAPGLRVTNWPLRDAPIRVLSILAGSLGIAAVCGWLSHSATMGGAAGAALLLALWKLWVPITTQFEPRGIVLSFLRQRRRIAWSDIDHLHLCEAGVFLCTQPPPLSRSVLRSFFLPWGDQRESISTFCQEYAPLALPGSSDS